MKASFLPALGSALLLFSVSASAQVFTPGNIVVSRLVYQNVGEVAALVAGQTSLPNSNGAKANHDGTFPGVFNNLTVDGNFGVLAPMFLDQLNAAGTVVSTYAVPTNAITTSFSSKSEGGITLSQDGTRLTFMGYGAPAGAIDRSNSNTPGIPVPGNTDTAAATFRQVAQVDAAGNLQTTTTNAYSGDNPRNAILGNSGLYYGVGNTGSTSATATGVRVITPGVNAPSNSPGTTSAGSYNITQNGYAADKLEKDNNFRGVTIFDNTLYVSKGSGSNGINSVYQVGNAGTLPTGSGNTISILPGFPTNLAKSGAGNPANSIMHPFGLWFANATTLYVADEGDGVLANAGSPVNNPFAGLQKWTLSNGTWSLAYTMTSGLNLGVAYAVPGDPNSPATDGLRNIAGRVNPDGTVTIYATTSTVSNGTEQGIDPNRLVAIMDALANKDSTFGLAEQFITVETATYGQVLRGVSFAPSAVPEHTSTFALMAIGCCGLLGRRRYGCDFSNRSN